MSPADLRFWMAAQRRVSSMQPDVQSAVLRAFQIIRDSLTDAQLQRIIDSGNLDRLFAEALDQATLDRAFIPLRQRMRQTTERGFRYTVPNLPGAGKVDGSLAVAFDHLSPDVVQAIRTMETKVITGLADDIRDTVRAFVENGIRDGKNPKAIGRTIRDVIGMSPTQEENARKYAAKLEAEGRPADQIERMVATYRRRAIALNAETNARTATLDAYKQGQALAWKQARDNGVIPPNARLVKTWRGVMDDRERDEHIAMEGETVGIDDPYSNGEMVPGDSTYNCRCISVIRASAA